MRNQKGMALTMTVIIMIGLIPFLCFLLTVTQHHILHSHKRKQIKIASSLASNVLIDFMRQFSQSYHEDRYSLEFLARDRTLYKAGFSEVTTVASSTGHYIHIQAIGKYGTNPHHPFSDRHLYATVQFISDMTDYGTYLDEDMNIGASDVTYHGKWWTTKNLTISGNNIRFVGGPLIVKGDVNITGRNIVIDGNLYHGGRLNDPQRRLTVRGNIYNFYPSGMEYPTVDERFYTANYHYRITTNRIIEFRAHPSSSTFVIRDSLLRPVTTVAIIESGMIILGENCNLTVFGTVRGRVTVVTVSDAPGNGNITIGLSDRRADLLYYNPLTGGTTIFSSLGNSFAAVAAGKITFQAKEGFLSRSDHTICGVFFQRDAGPIKQYGGGGRFTFCGSRNRSIKDDRDWKENRFIYDSWLNTSPPPGLPERPVLVTWHLR